MDEDMVDIRRHVKQKRVFESRRFQAMAERALNYPISPFARRAANCYEPADI
jgi:hypothetical protein